MFAELINHIIHRELSALRRELLAYPDEKDIWHTPKGIANSAGTLTLHLVGNLRHYIGAQLGGSGYVRDRDAEFSARNLPREQLLAQIDAAITEVASALADFDETKLDEVYPEAVGGFRMNTRDWLLHLVSHLGYHLGQVDYHRRLATGGQETVEGIIRIAELKTAVRESE